MSYTNFYTQPASGSKTENEGSDKDIRETFWSYLAGFFDGEGHIGTRWSGILWKITQSGEEGKCLLLQVQDIFRNNCGLAGRITVRRLKIPPNNLVKKPKHPRQYWELSVHHRDSVEFILKRLIPYLRIKRVTAQDVLRFCKIYPRITRGFIMRVDTQFCPNGHPYDKENTWMEKRGENLFARHCRACKRERDKRYYRERKVA